MTTAVRQADSSAEEIFEAVFKEMPPGPGLSLLLGSQEHAQLDDYDVVEMARAARRLAAWAASLEFGAIAELSARRKVQGERLGAWDSEVGEWVIDEVAAALTLSGGAAAHQVVVARQLAEQLPETARAAAAYNRVNAIAQALKTDGMNAPSTSCARTCMWRYCATSTQWPCFK